MRQIIKNMYGYTYLITNLINGHQYVGQHQYELPELDPNYFGSGLLLNKKIEEYGKENFSIELLDLCNNQDELNESETRNIYKYKTFVDWGYGGYNLTTGGEGFTVSESTKQKRSASVKAACQRPEVKENKSRTVKKYYENPENKQKTSIAVKAACQRPEVKENKSRGQKKRYENPEEHIKTSKSVKAACQRPEVKENKSRATKAACQRPEVKENRSKGQKKRFENPEEIQKARERQIKIMSRPEVRQKESESHKGINTWIKGSIYMTKDEQSIRVHPCDIEKYSLLGYKKGRNTTGAKNGRYNHIPKELLIELRVNQKLTHKQIAEKLNVGTGTISRRLKEYGIENLSR